MPKTTPLKTAKPDAHGVRPWLAVVRAYNLCDAVMARRLAAVGVRTAEHEVLANLAREPGIVQQVLAARCFTAKSHVSGLLSTLEERGLVTREADPMDARAKRLYLTPAGQALAQRTRAVQAEVVRVMAEALSPAEMAVVEATMDRVSERLRALQGE